MPSYDELKAELEVIAKTVDKFPEAVKSRVFDLLVQTFLGQSLPPLGSTPAAPSPPVSSPVQSWSTPPRRKRPILAKNAEELETAGEDADSKKPARRVSQKESYTIDRELNLRGDKSIPSFSAFVEEKKPGTTQEFNAVVVYYLQKMVGLKAVTLNQAYTCFTEAKKRPPAAFRQSFIDTKNRKGWLEFDAEGNLRIPHRGSVFVEHDLPPVSKAKA